MEILVPWKAVVDVGLCSGLSITAVVNRFCCKAGGQTTLFY